MVKRCYTVSKLVFCPRSRLMASNACLSALSAIEDVQIIHYYGLEVLTFAKRILISSLLLTGDQVDVEEFLKTTFKSKKQIILAPYYGEQLFLG